MRFPKWGYPLLSSKSSDHNLLVGGFNHVEKILVNGKDYPIYYGK